MIIGRVLEAADHVALVPQRLDDRDRGRDTALVVDLEMLGTDADDDLLGRGVGDRLRERRRAAGASTPASRTESSAPSATTVAGMVFIGGLPMKRATKRFAGVAYTSCGGSICWSTP